MSLRTHVGLPDLGRDARQEGVHARQVGFTLQLLVDAIVTTDRRLPTQVREVCLVTAVTGARAHMLHLLQGEYGRMTKHVELA